MSSIDVTLRKPGGLVPSCSGARAAFASDPRAHIRAKAILRLEVVMYIIKCYDMVNYKAIEIHLCHYLLVKNFKLEFDFIKEHRKREVSTPQISQKIDDVRWAKVFIDFLSRISGVRNILLACDVRPTHNSQNFTPLR